MAHKVIALVEPYGKQEYDIGTPSDVTFFVFEGQYYAQWWNSDQQLISMPVSQLLSID